MVNLMNESQPLLASQPTYTTTTTRNRRSSILVQDTSSTTSSHQTPEFSRQHRRPRPKSYRNFALNNEDPAKDLASGCCSYGCGCWQCIRTNQVGIVTRFGMVG